MTPTNNSLPIRPPAVSYNSWDSLDERLRSQPINRNVNRRDSSARDLDLIEIRDRIRELAHTDPEAQQVVAPIPEPHRLGWRSILQIVATFVGLCTLSIAITNLTDRLLREKRMNNP